MILRAWPGGHYRHLAELFGSNLAADASHVAESAMCGITFGGAKVARLDGGTNGDPR